MFEGLRGKTQGVVDEDYRREYNESVEATEDNDEENNSDYRICIETNNDDEYYVDDCKENWDALMSLNDNEGGFVILKDSSERKDGILGIRVSEIIVFYLEED